MSIPVSVQMYTLRDLTAKDFLGTIEEVAKIGFGGVELAGTFNVSAKDLRKHVESLGLIISGAHVGIDPLTNDFEATTDYYHAAGVEHIIVPWLPPERRKNWAEFGKSLNALGAKLKAKGMTLCYHNHDFEFAKEDGRYGLDLIFSNATHENLQAELDLYWVARAGENPAVYIKNFADRVPLVHVKDMAAGPEKRFAPVGTGVMDFAPIFAAAESLGIEWYVVEQDNCYDTPPLEAIKTSMRNLREMGIV